METFFKYWIQYLLQPHEVPSTGVSVCRQGNHSTPSALRWLALRSQAVWSAPSLGPRQLFLVCAFYLCCAGTPATLSWLITNAQESGEKQKPQCAWRALNWHRFFLFRPIVHYCFYRCCNYFSFLISVLLRCNTHTTKSKGFKCVIQWILVYWHSHTLVTTI